MKELTEDSKWQQAISGAARSAEALAALFPHRSLHALQEVMAVYPAAVTSYYGSLIDPDDPDDPIGRLCIPDPRELESRQAFPPDPFAEASSTPVPGLFHRYPDRVLLMLQHCCAVYCRHCTRKRLAGKAAGANSVVELEAALDYIGRHPEVHEVILSGGDPLLLEDDRLLHIMERLSSLPNVEWLRLGTRIPVVLPARLTPTLAAGLGRLPKPVFLLAQFNHPRELTGEARDGLALLRQNGVVLANQSVLLKGVNDRAEIMEALCRGLLSAGVRPYYLFQCDPVAGIEHLRCDIRVGLALMEQLSSRIGGLGLPRYVVDLPGTRGKIPLWPDTAIAFEDGVALIHHAGAVYRYPQGVG